MKKTVGVLSVTAFLVLYFCSIVSVCGCKSVVDSITRLEMHLSDNMEGGTNMDIVVDCLKKTGTIKATVNGVDPSYYDSAKPEKLPAETVSAIIRHLDIQELEKLDSSYIGKENSHLNSTINITTKRRHIKTEVSGNSGNVYLRKLHVLAYGVDF
ncbi:MAG: hypothetical protein ACKO6I_08030 [Sphingomonadales bacterium]